MSFKEFAGETSSRVVGHIVGGLILAAIVTLMALVMHKDEGKDQLPVKPHEAVIRT